MEDRSRYLWGYMDYLKLAVILVIVLNHSIQYEWNAYKILSNDFQNPTLLFASGVIFSYCIAKLGKYPTFANLLKKKAKRLLIPLFCTLFLYYFPFIKITNRFIPFDANYDRPFHETAFDYLMGINIDHLWFLYALFILYVAFYPIVRKDVLLHTKKGQFCLLAFLFLLNISTLWQTPERFCLRQVMQYSFFFAGGFIYNLHAEKFFEKNERGKRICLLVVAIVAAACLYAADYATGFLAGKEYKGNEEWLPLLSAAEILKQSCLICLVCSGIRFLHERTAFFKFEIFPYLAKNSFRIYLFHQPVVRVFLPMIRSGIQPQSDMANLSCSLITFSVAVAGSLFFSKIVDRLNAMPFRARPASPV